MKKSEINFHIELDSQNVPEKIEWKATDGPTDALQATNAIAISIWDHTQANTLRIDLWAKDMLVPDMKQFIVEIIGGMGDTASNATGDPKMGEMIHDFTRQLAKYVMEENKKAK